MNIPVELTDLHRHLDGSLRWSTLLELASNQGVQIPSRVDDVRFFSGMGLEEALGRFAITLSVLQGPDAVRRVASEMCEDASEEGIGTLEIRFAPQLHAGAAMEEIVDAASSGVGGHATLILCGLYGEAPATLEKLVEIAASRPRVVGIDLAGGPAPDHRYSMTDYAPAFRRARDLGLGRTVHAGEGRAPREIRTAIEDLHALRVGHGTTLLDDPDVLDLILRRQITVEACPTSNVHTGVISTVAEHPLKRWLDLGVRVCVCADNTLLSNTDVRKEHERIAQIPGLTEDDQARLVHNGRTGAFQRN
jgi:adenosine deaminase